MLTSPAELAARRDEWSALLARSDSNQPTLSPDWLLTWWNVFGDERALKAVLFVDDGRLVGLAALSARLHRHRGAIPFRRLELLGSGEPEADEICSEYIGPIAERGGEAQVARALADSLASDRLGEWDELVLPAMDGDLPLPRLLAEELGRRGFAVETTITARAPHIPLPASWPDYLAALPGSRRYAIQRALRDFERYAGAEAKFHIAQNEDEVARGRAILLELHAERWRAEGGTGAFASPRFRAFHDTMMPLLLRAGALELLWLELRGEPLAALYNIVWDGKVQYYQSGRRMQLPKSVRPGLVLHAHAIRRAIEAGRREYDFLAGEPAWKLQLALATRPIVELRVARPGWRETARGLTERGLAWARRLRKR